MAFIGNQLLIQFWILSPVCLLVSNTVAVVGI